MIILLFFFSIKILKSCSLFTFNYMTFTGERDFQDRGGTHNKRILVAVILRSDYNTTSAKGFVRGC